MARPTNLIVDRSAGFSLRYPLGWTAWSYGWKVFIAPSVDPPLELRRHGLEGEQGFSIQIWSPVATSFKQSVSAFRSALDVFVEEGAAISHSQPEIAGRLAERYRVSYPRSAPAIFGADDSRFARACASCEAEYTFVRWPGSVAEIAVRIDAVAHPDTSLADHRASIDFVSDSLRAYESVPLSNRYIAIGPDDTAADTVMAFMDARIAGERAEIYLDPAALSAYSARRPLYWFKTPRTKGSYQILARIPIDQDTIRFEIMMGEVGSDHIGRSEVEFLEVRLRGADVLIVSAPECRQSGAALLACLFA